MRGWTHPGALEVGALKFMPPGDTEAMSSWAMGVSVPEIDLHRMRGGDEGVGGGGQRWVPQGICVRKQGAHFRERE